MKTCHSLELLETRIAPAALFNATVNSLGVLKVVPYADWATDEITYPVLHVTQTAAREFDISDGTETTHVTDVKRINVALKGDNDSVSFNFLPKLDGGFRGIVSAVTGVGQDTVALEGGYLAGRFSGNGGNAPDGDPAIPNINSRFFIYDAMTVTNAVVWSGPGVFAGIEGLTRSVTINGALLVFSNAGTVASDLTVRGYNAPDGVPVFDSRVELRGTYGGLNLTGGDGNEFFVIGGTTRETVSINTGLGNDIVAIEARITGNAKVNLGNGDNFIVMRGSQVYGNFRVNGGDDRDFFVTEIGFPGYHPSPDGLPEVYGRLILNMSGGENRTEIFNSNLHRGLTYTGGAGVDFVRIDPENVTWGGPMGTIHGVIDISAGDGLNLLGVHTWSNVHTLNYRGGDEVDIVTMYGPGGGLLEGRVLLGGGDDHFAVQFSSDAIFDVAMTVDGGAGTDMAHFLAGALDPVTGFVTPVGPGHYQIGEFIDLLVEIAAEDAIF